MTENEEGEERGDAIPSPMVMSASATVPLAAISKRASLERRVTSLRKREIREATRMKDKMKPGTDLLTDLVLAPRALRTSGVFSSSSMRARG